MLIKRWLANLSSIKYDCPNCGTKNTGFTKESSIYVSPAVTIQHGHKDICLTTVEETLNHLIGLSLGSTHLFYSIFRCNTCQRNAAIVFQFKSHSTGTLDGEVSLSEIFPSLKSMIPDMPNTPLNIVNCFSEAIGCFDAGFLKGALLVLRTTLNLIVLDKGYPNPADNLKKKIDYLEANILESKSMKRAAHIIRRFGNDMGHPENWFKEYDADNNQSVEKDFDREDIMQLINFLKEIIDDIYEEPYRIAALEKKPISK